PDPAADDSDRALSELGAQVARSERPVVIAGSLAVRRPWGRRLATLRVPVFTTLAAKGVLDETTPFAAGVFTGDGRARSPEAIILAEADLVVGLGLRNLEVLSVKPFPCALAVVDVVGGPLADGFAPSALCRTSGDDAFDDILDALSVKEWGVERLAKATAG